MTSCLALLAELSQSSVRGDWPLSPSWPRGLYVNLQIKITDWGPASPSPFLWRMGVRANVLHLVRKSHASSAGWSM